MAKIHTPVKGFTGSVVGVTFADGVGETDEPAKLAYFHRHGYTVEEKTAKTVEIPEGAPSEEWKVDQLKAYAEKHDLDLGSAKTKPEMVAAIKAAEAKKTADSGSQD